MQLTGTYGFYYNLMLKFSYFIYKLIKFDFQIISREFDEKFESLHYAVPSADLHSLISQVWLLLFGYCKMFMSMLING